MFLENDEMKFAILYTLKVYNHPVSLEKLARILTWDEDVMSYFDLTILLSELIEDSFIERLYYLNEECVRLSSRGEDTAEFFSERVPGSIRQRIKETADRDSFDEKTNPNAVISEIIPVALNRYMAELKILDAGTSIFELRMDVGRRAEAERAKEILKSKSEEIYAYLCKILDESE
ncbi:MAG: DUF4364 family protein [Clostridiales bacterium]|nr:DUF4364 family protein [Clostridiales bacterium]